jgi:small nuclear ribonucleoprotein (snRNP)-like protein
VVLALASELVDKCIGSRLLIIMKGDKEVTGQWKRWQQQMRAAL